MKRESKNNIPIKCCKAKILKSSHRDFLMDENKLELVLRRLSSFGPVIGVRITHLWAQSWAVSLQTILEKNKNKENRNIERERRLVTVSQQTPPRRVTPPPPPPPPLAIYPPVLTR
ncbi:hypothetical protein STAS_13157 [Striga asiatica]|uniref:Uncharacterized protein n=1 Tax=Striga asiatica TaxID=4170 RepID=A0A5A7PVA9_STRAF|nr:hypothetical protein STAS_13157 [Striga asiatica]